MTGVYEIWIGDYFYHGSTENFNKRCRQHFKALQNGNHNNNKMQNAFNKYGTFDFKIIISCDSRDAAYDYEQDFIDTHFGLDKCLNLNPDASRPPSMRDRKHSEETRQKMSESHKGKIVIVSEETKQKMSESHKGLTSPNKGKTLSEEWKQNLSKSTKGRRREPFSKETKQRMSESQKKKSKSPCTHCGLMVTTTNMTRWHGDNCKKKLQQLENNPEISQDAEYIRLSAQS